MAKQDPPGRQYKHLLREPVSNPNEPDASNTSSNTNTNTSSSSSSWKLVHVVSLLGLLLVGTGLFQSMQSQQSMQSMYKNMQAGVEYAAGSAAAITAAAAAAASDTHVSAAATHEGSDGSASHDNHKSNHHNHKSKKNRTISTILPSFLATAAGKLRTPQHVQRTTDASSTTPTSDTSSTQSSPKDNASANQKEENKKKDKPLNILLLYADDWTMKTLGTLNPVVKTPVLDELAARGMLFTNNCVTTSICWISRSTLVTGQYAGKHQHLKIFQQVLYEDNKWNQTLFPQLKHAGYYTGFVGKWHAPSPPEHMKYSFDVRNFYYGHHWEHRDGKQQHVTDLNRQDAIKFLKERDTNKPFALGVSFFATHAVDGAHYPDQYQPMPTSMSLYANDTIPNAVTNTQKDWDELPWFFENRNEGRGRWKNRYDVPERYQVSMKNYYRMATEVDTACGQVIAELKKQGVYDNTLIIFTTDNGVSDCISFLSLSL
jgi:hypothetical protein